MRPVEFLIYICNVCLYSFKKKEPYLSLAAQIFSGVLPDEFRTGADFVKLSSCAVK